MKKGFMTFMRDIRSGNNGLSQRKLENSPGEKWTSPISAVLIEALYVSPSSPIDKH